jgi:hypothetical protein
MASCGRGTDALTLDGVPPGAVSLCAVVLGPGVLAGRRIADEASGGFPKAAEGEP